MTEIANFIKCSGFKRAFFTLFSLHILALGALILANVYYKDDTLRILTNRSWDGDGRVLATFLYDFLHFFRDRLDIYPLSLALAIGFACLSAMILVFAVRGKFEFSALLAASTLTLHPMFLQCFSYRYECLIMNFALFCVFVPFLFRASLAKFAAVSVAALVVMFLTYQAVSGVYVVLALFFAFLGACGADAELAGASVGSGGGANSNLAGAAGGAAVSPRAKWRAVLSRLGVAAGSFAVAAVVYKLFLSFAKLESYTAGKNQILPLDELLLGGQINYYLTYLLDYLAGVPAFWFMVALGGVFLCGCALAGAGGFGRGVNYAGRGGRVKLAARNVIFGTIYLGLATSLFMGIYIALVEAFVAVRAFMGFGSVVATAGVAAVAFGKGAGWGSVAGAAARNGAAGNFAGEGAAQNPAGQGGREAWTGDKSSAPNSNLDAFSQLSLKIVNPQNQTAQPSQNSGGDFAATNSALNSVKNSAENSMTNSAVNSAPNFSPTSAPLSAQNFAPTPPATIAAKIYRALLNSNLALIVLFCMVFANAYGNAYRAQFRWMEFRVTMFAADYQRFARHNAYPRLLSGGTITYTDQDSLHFVGSIGYAPLTRHFVETYAPLAEALVAVPNGTDRSWFYSFFINKNFAIDNFNRFTKTACRGVSNEAIAKAEVVVTTKYHEIKRVNQCFIVRFFKEY